MKLLGLVGHPLTHSFSAKYFSEKFQELGLTDYEYRNFDIPDISLIREICEAHPELKGFNVTIPYKESIIPFLDGVDPEAQLIGAVNCVQINDEGLLIGYNTDSYGFYHSIKPFLENKNERALILGTGGSSKAVAYVLKKLGIKVFYASRNPSATNHVAYSEINAETIAYFPLIINCTPLGTFPNINECPDIPYDGLNESHFLYDLTYNPSESLFLQKGKEKGALTSNGLLMLQLQAEKSWKIWHQ